VSADALSPDVLVIGGGTAGLCAAAAAARAGARVTVLKKAGGATLLSSGAVDVADPLLGHVPGSAGAAPLDAGGSLAGAMELLAARRPRHPYARLGAAGRARLDDALALLGGLAAGLELTAGFDKRNAVVATELGTVKRTALVQGSSALDLSRLPEGELLVADLADVARFDGRPVADMLAWTARLSGVERAVGVLAVPAVQGAPLAETPRELAARLDDAGRAALVERVARALRAREGGPPAAILLPPILGLEGSAALRRALEEACGCPVGELLALPPSAPGERLSRALIAGAAKDGVEVRQADARSSLTEGGRVLEVRAVEQKLHLVFKPRAIVLASGRFLGGGVVRDGYAIEPLFGLPVVSGEGVVGDRFIGGLTADRWEGEHAIFRAGLAYDARLRPLAASGAACAENLFAAGSILEGYDPARDGSGLGVAALTGMLAGEAAAALLGRVEKVRVPEARGLS
jgi:glycerol-3-phosphate dehydrogenase subunit B